MFFKRKRNEQDIFYKNLSKLESIFDSANKKRQKKSQRQILNHGLRWQALPYHSQIVLAANAFDNVNNELANAFSVLIVENNTVKEQDQPKLKQFLKEVQNIIQPNSAARVYFEIDQIAKINAIVHSLNQYLPPAYNELNQSITFHS